MHMQTITALDYAEFDCEELDLLRKLISMKVPSSTYITSRIICAVKLSGF